MTKTRLCSLLTALVFLVLIAACGNKGDLVRPVPKADAPASS